jgi:hypothetical protein
VRALSLAAIVGLASFFGVRVLRVLPVLRDWFAAGRKPLACNVCLTFWVAGACTVALVATTSPVAALWWAWPCGAGIALALLEWLGQPPPADLP